jgi:hypothetical protein
LKKLLLILFAAMLLSGCMNNYYERFGGFPYGYEQYVINTDQPDIRLLVTYRYAYQDANPDTMSFNVSVDVIVAHEDLDWVSIDKLSLASRDGSYLMTYAFPAVYEPNSRFPVTRQYTDPETNQSVTPSHSPSVFTISKEIMEYDLTVSYRTYEDSEVIARVSRSVSINLAEIKRSARYL